MTKRYIEIDVENFLIVFGFLGAAFAYRAYLKASDAKRGAWAAYDELHDYRSAVEESPSDRDDDDRDE